LAHCVGGHVVDSEGGEVEERDVGKMEKWKNGMMERWNEKQPGSVRTGWIFQRWPDLRVGNGDGVVE